MTGDEFRSILGALQIPHRQFARMVGADVQTASKWATNKTRVPGSVDVLLRLLTMRPELVAVLQEMEPPATRERGEPVPRPRSKRRAA